MGRPVKKIAVFRPDGGRKVGGGHIMRCLSLASALERQGYDCAFIVSPEASDVVPALAISGYDFFQLCEADQNEGTIAQRQWPSGVDWVVVDHYGLDASMEQTFRDWAKRVMVIDDLANRLHDCDLLLDQTPERTETDYETLLPAGARQLLGPNFALLRPEFSKTRANSLARRETQSSVKTVFVNFGLTDPQGLTLTALEAIKMVFPDVSVDVAIGATAPCLEKVWALAKNQNGLMRLHVGADDIAMLMAGADIAVGAAGTTLWERCAVGLPAVAICVVDNQKKVAQALERAGAASVIQWHANVDAGTIAERLAVISQDPTMIRAMSQKAAALCDGLGAERVVKTMLHILNKEGLTSINERAN